MTEPKNDQMERYYTRRALGRCPVCGGERPEDDDRIVCEKCRARMGQYTAYKAAHMTADQIAERNAKARERQKKARARLRSEGRCAGCGAPSPDRYFCATCTAKRKAQKAARDAAKK